MIERVQNRFGHELAMYHSALSPQEKYEQYLKVRNGQARIVVGTRSAVFLPFTDLGLIVMDEEHETSYKQDKQPSYHCRDVAIYRAGYHHCKVLLASATPSLDSYARAKKGVYALVEMTERVNQSLPEITIVNTRDEIQEWTDPTYAEECLLKETTLTDAYTKSCLAWYDKWAEFHPEPDVQ